MRILITGGMGFIGSNLLERFAPNHDVFVMDNLSREGSLENYIKLFREYKFSFARHDISKPFSDIGEFDVIYHMAAQVGVQASIADPIKDMHDNIIGTMNVLEYARHQSRTPVVIFASTNKVYGSLQVEEPVSEDTPLDFHTPYGVSKGAAEQYVLDYDRIYGIPGIVFRQSCIYGKNQLGAEEQGWLAWFLIANRTRQPITIYGDGNQVRDALYIDDLVDLYEQASEGSMHGQAFNVGGGPENTLSLNQLIEKANIDTKISFSDWRPADQRYYVSDITKVKKAFNWEPKINVDEGIRLTNKYVEARWQKYQ